MTSKVIVGEVLSIQGVSLGRAGPLLLDHQPKAVRYVNGDQPTHYRNLAVFLAIFFGCFTNCLPAFMPSRLALLVA